MSGDVRNNGGSAGRDARGRFTIGNPGRRPGSRHKATLAVEAVLEGEAEALTRKAVELALSGDTTALRLCHERLAPVRKGGPVTFDLPDELGDVASLRRVVETGELEARVAELERKRR